MKKLTVSILLLLSSINIFGCGYSPYGEDIRYCLFRPDYFSFGAYQSFYYNANQWGYENYYQTNKPSFYESNILDWYNYTQKKLPVSEIEMFNYHLKLTDIHPNSGNKFLDYLYKNKKEKIIRYLIFSKKCEDFNTLQETDVWEREGKADKAKSEKFYAELYNAYKNEDNAYLKRKYAFQCIRFSFYTNDANSINTIFDETFKNGKQDYLYFWSLYFTCFSSPDNHDVKVARLFAYSPEKAQACYHYFNDHFVLKEALARAKTKSDVANIYAFASAQKTDKNLGYLKIIYQNNPNMRMLDFMLLREINKVEDWIYTPYYSNYLPSILELNYYWSDTQDKVTTEILRQRSETDRLYAQEMLDFVNSVDFNKVNNPVLWKASQIQLLFMTRKFEECLKKIEDFKKSHSEERVFAQVEQIKALCLTANQAYGKAIVKDEVKPLFLKYRDNSRFVFALGRELEFLGNLPDGMAMISSINKGDRYDNYREGSEGVEWKGNRLKTTDNMSSFYEYFDYLDFVYSAKELQVVLNKVNTKMDDEFESTLYQYLRKDKNYLADLLGTKYLRENYIDSALKTFRSLPKKYWDDNYNPWERDRYDEQFNFDENPFYSFKYTEDFIPHREKFIVNKLSITQHLVTYLKKAGNPKTADRDYYYFLVANCFLNMGDSGNSWMMRRYTSNGSWGFNDSYYDESYIDEREYRTNKMARYYYDMAYKEAKTDKFKALCVRMIDFAESGYPNDFGKLKKAYPDYYSDLSNCVSLDSYFNARR
jgi:hypothetical protein